MNATTEKFASANKANVETLLTIANTAFASAERLAALNLNTARAFLEDSVTNAKALMAVKDVKELVAVQAALAQPSAEKVVAYSRSVYEIATETQGELSKVVGAQVSDIKANVSTAFEKAVKNAPAGSDVAVSAVKSAIAAANSAYDSMSKAAKQASEIAEANVAAATTAAVKAVGTAAAKVKKAAQASFKTSSTSPPKGLDLNPVPTRCRVFLLGIRKIPHRVATRRANPFDANRCQNSRAFELRDDARDGFEAQVGNVGNVLARRQDDLAGPVGQQAHQSHDAIYGLATTQGHDVGRSPLRRGQGFEQRLSVRSAFHFRPGSQLTMRQGGRGKGVRAKQQGFAAEDIAGNGQAGERGMTRWRDAVKAHYAMSDPPCQTVTARHKNALCRPHDDCLPPCSPFLSNAHCTRLAAVTR